MVLQFAQNTCGNTNILDDVAGEGLFCFEQTNQYSETLVENKTVEENILMIDKRYRNQMTVSSMLEKVGLKGYEHNKIYTLSWGEQQRVAIARLLMKKCSIILADEPTGSLDKYNANLIVEHLKELNSIGKTIILVTHDEEF